MSDVYPMLCVVAGRASRLFQAGSRYCWRPVATRQGRRTSTYVSSHVRLSQKRNPMDGGSVTPIHADSQQFAWVRKDSRIQGFKDSRIQGFKDSQGYREGRGLAAPHSPHQARFHFACVSPTGVVLVSYECRTECLSYGYTDGTRWDRYECSLAEPEATRRDAHRHLGPPAPQQQSPARRTPLTGYSPAPRRASDRE